MRIENNLVRKMINTIEQHNMIQANDRVIVGVSGGADSVALLRALRAVQSNYNLTLIVCHVNHKIRPGAAERDQKFVEELCRELGVECHVKEAHVETLAKEWNMSDEEAGRKVRYDFFNETAGVYGKIATAHNKNDNAETVMMRFMRGTGLHGLTGIPYQRDNIIRPILDISRDEIEEYLEEIGQTHITDETNLQPIYTRNKIRLNLIPEIQREFNPNFVETLTNNISTYRDEDKSSI
jgi:tRNA(Ile)-lysidine synthase